MATAMPHGKSWKVRFYDQTKTRRSLSVGKCGKKAAESAARHVEALVNAVIGGRQPGSAHIVWASSQQPRIRAKLAEWGLFQSEEPEAIVECQTRKLEELFEAYCKARTSVSAATRRLWHRSYGYLCEHFTAAMPIEDITNGDAYDFREYMVQRRSRKVRKGEDGAPKMSENTVRKTTSHARQFFKYAVRKGWIQANPFQAEDLPVTVGSRDKQYIPLNTIRTALQLMPSREWEAVLLLARVCGLRVQSEGPLLEWSHIDWNRGIIAVTDVKRGRGHGRMRRCPLFPEVRSVLADLFEAAPEGSRFVLEPLIEKSDNWRRPLEKWLKRGGIEPWPALFNSLRSSAETDIEREYGLPAACAWVGNSFRVAADHYLTVPETTFETASKRVPKWDPNLTEPSRIMGHVVGHDSERPGTFGLRKPGNTTKTGVSAT